MPYILLSFLAGILTVFAPCTFTLLPVILTGTLHDTRIKRALTIIVSLSVSLFVFTLILKASTLLIYVSQDFWNILSGGIIFFFGIFTLFPEIWSKVSNVLKLRSDRMMERAAAREDLIGNILIGAALGPVFSSCSPTYALIIATILPQDFGSGVFYLVIYILGLALTLLLITVFGQKLISKVKWATNPNGVFKKILGVIFVVIGLMIITGLDKTLETAALNAGFLDETKIEINYLNNPTQNTTNTSNISGPGASVLNVNSPYPAPNFTGIDNWINSQPLNISDLKGKVVLVDFWTYSCINCIRTLPYIKQWNTKYKDQGLVIVGVHTPEFAFEHLAANVQKFASENDLEYPIAQDNNYSTWNAFNNQYWPADYLIDKNGQVRYTAFGEGDYDKTEEAIQYLLGLSNINSDLGSVKVPISRSQSPETYLNYEKGQNFANTSEIEPDSTVNYTDQGTLQANEWEFVGAWNIGPESSTSEGDNSELKFNFSAKNVYLVMGAQNLSKVQVKLNGKIVDSSNAGSDVGSAGTASVQYSKLYTLINLPQFEANQQLDLIFPKGVQVNAFTFGS